jgi:hypothetical protein
MCRSIKTLHNFQPPATDEEIRASSLRFVRKLSGTSKPSASERAFTRAVDGARAADSSSFSGHRAPARDREVEAAKARPDAAARLAARVPS